MVFNWYSQHIRRLVQSALAEDAARRDITTKALIPSGFKLKADIKAKQAGVVCGLPLAKAFFQALDPHVLLNIAVFEGQKVKPGQPLMRMDGNARAILSAERPALNAIQHLSGISTFTHSQVQRMGSSKTKIYDTRKTLPGWRALQKYAVQCGGGVNHRSSLSEAVLIKENHMKVLRLAGIDWRVPARALQLKGFPLEVEIQTPQDLREILNLQPKVVLLDNMHPERLKKIIRLLHKKVPGVHIEISGGVQPKDLSRLKKLGADRISMGCLTHSTPAFDCSLDILRVFR